jgi:hypothetical protein
VIKSEVNVSSTSDLVTGHVTIKSDLANECKTSAVGDELGTDVGRLDGFDVGAGVMG